MNNEILSYLSPLYLVLGIAVASLGAMAIHYRRQFLISEYRSEKNELRHEIAHHIRVMLESKIELAKLDAIRMTRQLNEEEQESYLEDAAIIEGRTEIVKNINEKLKALDI